MIQRDILKPYREALEARVTEEDIQFVMKTLEPSVRASFFPHIPPETVDFLIHDDLIQAELRWKALSKILGHDAERTVEAWERFRGIAEVWEIPDHLKIRPKPSWREKFKIMWT